MSKENDISSVENALRQLLPLDTRNNSLKYTSVYTDFNDNKHYSFSQYYKGVRVEDACYKVHYKGDDIDYVGGDFRTIDNLSVQPSLSEVEALKKALSHIGAKKYMWEDEGMEKLLKTERGDPLATNYPKGELVVYFNQKEVPVLVYKFDIYAISPLSHDYVYTNAINGNIEGVETRIYFANGTAYTRLSGTRTIQTEAVAGGYRLFDATRGRGIRTLNMKGEEDYFSRATEYIDNNNIWTVAEWDNANKDNAALDVHWATLTTYDYFLQKHGRNSYDNAGGQLLSYVNFDLTKYSDDYTHSDNAFWLRDRMVYGEGTNYQPYVSLDIIAHEIGHGVCQFTAGLNYSNESGALNEGFSDIWGACVENYAKPSSVNNWTIGEEVKPPYMRNMKDPRLNGYPRNYGGANWVQTVSNPDRSNDYGGVHKNSSVLNHWFYLLVNGGSGTNDYNTSYSVQGIGIDKASKIVYATLMLLPLHLTLLRHVIGVFWLQGTCMEPLPMKHLR